MSLRSSLALLPLLAGCSHGCAHTLTIPQPASEGPGAPLPPLEATSVALPLQADLRGTLRSLEAAVPSEFGTGDRFEMIGATPVGVRYRATRGPFRFTPRGPVLHAETTVSLRAEACVGAPLGIPIPLLPGCQVVASCGVDEPLREVVVGADTQVSLDGSWRLVSHTVPTEPVFRNRCELTMFRVDVTTVAAAFVTQQVAAATARMDRTVAANGDLSARARELWTGLQAPMDLGDGFRLALRPERVFASPFELQGETARTVVGIVARPEVTSGPAAQDAPTPLPTLESVPDGGAQGAFALTLDARVSFAEAQTLVDEQFRGRVMELDGHRALVRRIGVRGNGAALLFDADVTFQDGAFAGVPATLYLAGLPEYDAAREALVVRRLDYTLETRNALLRAGEWMLRGSLRTGLAERAVFPVGDRIRRLRDGAARAMTRSLGAGSELRGTLGDVRPVGAYVTDGGIVVRVRVDGRAEVREDLTGIDLAHGSPAGRPDASP